MKRRGDIANKAKNSKLSVGDLVFLRKPIVGKDSTVYDPIPFTIESLNGTQAVISLDQTIKFSFYI